MCVLPYHESEGWWRGRTKRTVRMTPVLEDNWSYLSVKVAVLAVFQNKVSFFCHFIWLLQSKQSLHQPTHLHGFVITANLSIPANCLLIFVGIHGPPDNYVFTAPSGQN